MDLSRIFTIGGKPGLQKLVAQSKNGIIVESLIDKKRFNASATSKISSLEDISIFCSNEDLPLKDALETIAKKNKFEKVELDKDDQLKEQLSSFIENLDEDRVYNSDVKKIFKWYNLLLSCGILVKEEEEKEEKKSTTKKAPAKKAATKKPAAKKPAAKKKDAEK